VRLALQVRARAFGMASASVRAAWRMNGKLSPPASARVGTGTAAARSVGNEPSPMMMVS
jgi:hypothetical protein